MFLATDEGLVHTIDEQNRKPPLNTSAFNAEEWSVLYITAKKASVPFQEGRNLKGLNSWVDTKKFLVMQKEEAR